MPGERGDGRGGAEGFAGGLFRGEPGRVTFALAGELLAILNFTFGEDTIDESVPVFFNRVFEPRNFNNIYPDACDHKLISNLRLEIRDKDSRWSISLFAKLTTCGSWSAIRLNRSASKTRSARALEASVLCRQTRSAWEISARTSAKT